MSNNFYKDINILYIIMYKRIYIVTVLLIIFCITYYVKNNYIKDKFQDLTTNAVETQYHLFLGYISSINSSNLL